MLLKALDNEPQRQLSIADLASRVHAAHAVLLRGRTWRAANAHGAGSCFVLGIANQSGTSKSTELVGLRSSS
jgi:hypothetical protein